MFKKICIIGCGLIGSSLARAIKNDIKQAGEAIKDAKLKVTPAIQGDEIRVSGKKIDDLQKVIALVRGLKDLKAPLVFGNFK